MLLDDLVRTSREVTATRSRNRKTAVLAALLARLEPAEVAPAVAFLAGEVRQGRIGVGWAALRQVAPPPAAAPSLTIARVDAALTDLARLTGSGSGAARRRVLEELFARATEDEQRYLRALLLGELRQGALEGVMVEAVAAAGSVPAEAVRRALMLSGRLAEATTAALTGGEPALAAFGLRVGRPVRPMLASPAESLAEALRELARPVVEYKLDGARIQVHRDGDAVRVFTRTLREVTDGVPELVEVVRALPCRSVVLDGETLALTDAGTPRPFQETMSRFGAASPRELLLRPYFFDCLHLDGTDLLDAPLGERRAALGAVAGEHRMPALEEPDEDAAERMMGRALAEGHEGVMVKSLDGRYAAGRRGRSWRKVKPAHTLDLVVIAAEWGSGRRVGTLSNLHLGARDPDGGEPVMVGKTFKGLTDELLAWQTRELLAREVGRDGHAVLVRPELVVEIELDGVQTSPRYPGGVALRFARVLRYRPDKGPAEADDLTAVRAMLPGEAGRAGRAGE
ncbi:ATP-dependent DNA ligase [Allostreptomyces psammosilenae]|uniref:Probable DNA ligase n=1 Tax=Allostreptomyces psammosilenae TaxID=1892865 RepID=A0A852ZMH3_9ACTN|nr:ATP-dependent DNA ligase [Allostreptomyces psammosilenae]NYI03626.1 DNA ligase-1 [Allostreptomyces psammosilenae]